ncbi:Serine/threonine-protein kinase PknB [Stieleria neptunia]|uniref:non-specific serine/threonine protein kinase n=1 Tax=Stieleria neptunia TaxID=2527979 RepID=A0A518HU20_9BACT|nr:serine/threonine-protein kinase [Stieleria neptunia]QDV44319.1 Serine/threonine-protein kinase PknB [Stieleria neptunia]
MNEFELFDAALEIDDERQRREMLDRACRDDAALRRSVESLLSAHRQASGFLDLPISLTMPTETTTVQTDGGKHPDFPFFDSPTRQDSIGRIGTFEALQLLGRGGNGIVFKAFDEKLHRIVALKVMAPELTATSPARKRFLREARAAASLQHSSIVNVYSVESGPFPYLTMEFIDGPSLQQYVAQSGPLEIADVCRWGAQIAEGLAAAHDRNLLHRDIKPANILLQRGSDQAKITDFGLARAVDDASLTRSGMIAGTPMYMSPEQARGQTIDQRSDLFSLGSVLYVMLTGRPPFRAAHSLAVMKRLTEEQPRAIQELIPEVPSWLVDVVSRLHAKKPEDRFQNGLDVANALRTHFAPPMHASNATPRTSTAAPPILAEHDRSDAQVSPQIKTSGASRGTRKRVPGVVGVLAVGFAISALAIAKIDSWNSGSWTTSSGTSAESNKSDADPLAGAASTDTLESGLLVQSEPPIQDENPTMDSVREGRDPEVLASAVLLGASRSSLEQWLSGLDDAVPIGIGLRSGSTDPTFDAVAITQRNTPQWQANFVKDDREAGKDYQQMRGTHGVYWRLTIPFPGRKPWECEGIKLWKRSMGNWETRNHGQRPIRQVISGLQNSSKYPLSISVVESNGETNTHLLTKHRPGLANHAYGQLTLEQLVQRVALHRQDDWRLEYFQLNSGTPEARFAAVFCENNTPRHWELSVGLTAPEFWEMRSAKRSDGFYPRSLGSYWSDGKVFVAVLWHDIYHNPIY